MYSLNCKGKLLNLEKPIVMGILNFTKDSFYHSLKNPSSNEIIDFAGKMIEDGATILDIGGQSTRPGSERLSANEELERVIPVIETIRSFNKNIILSVDTYHSEVAKKSVEAGVEIINDISGGDFDSAMISNVAAMKVPYICMHIQGVPETMQENPTYENVVNDVYRNLQAKIQNCREAGIADIIIDPGFGFGKTVKHNYTLLNNLDIFNHLKVPILVGLSRKGMITKVLKNDVQSALNGTTALNMIALKNGAKILRVHDVKPAMECILLHQELVSTLNAD